MRGGGVPAAAARVVYVDGAVALERVCERLAVAERFALDTEFVGERSYLPVLELVQVATEEDVALIDCRAVPALDPFLAVLADARVEKIMHAGQQDLELFETLTGRVPAPIVDTQVAAAMAGYGAQIGYAQLVERLIGVTVEKSETLTDWSRRPLTPAQRAYAVDDVRYLLPVYERLRERLLALGRWEWLGEECRRIERSVRSSRVRPEDAWMRVRGRGTLRPKGLAVLRELAAWREELARSRNKPRSSVARDEVLVEIARRAPTTPEGLQSLRALRSRELERHADEVIERISRALASPREEWPKPPPAPPSSSATGVIELLQAVLRLRAEEAGIAPSLLATHADLQVLVQHHTAREAHLLPIMQGWRRQIAGGDLVALLEGRASLALDPNTGAVKIDSLRS